MITGTKAETVFMELLESQGHVVSKATEEQDMVHHIDCFVNGESYDIKGNKRLSRYSKQDENIIWIERTNVRGALGWLFGSATYIVFLVGTEFWVIRRSALVAWVINEIPYKEILSKKGYKTWYRRKDRLDCVTYVYTQDIEHLVERKYKIP